MSRQRWDRVNSGFWVCSALRLAVERSPDDGWWYVLRTDGDGAILPHEDAVGWRKSALQAKQLAEATGE